MRPRIEEEAVRHPFRASTRRQKLRATLRALGPGLVTGAADDDPSGIATYSQAGAQFGFGLLWTMPAISPFMIAIQLAAARIGRVTGEGLAANFRRHYSPALVWALVLLLLAANVINITADIAAMGEALQLVVGGGEHGHALVFGVLLALAQVRLSYVRLASLLRWLCLSLLAYAGVLLFVHLDWREALLGLAWPRLPPGADVWLVVVAVLGTTISPYLFFWQAGQEVEEMRRKGAAPLIETPEYGVRELLRIRFDTTSGMLFSNLIAVAIMLAAASTLHVHGITDVETATQAAQALQPLAGQHATWLFAAGIIGTGLLAVPVLAGSAAYAVADAMGWRSGLDHRLSEAHGFYAIIIGATIGGTALDFTPLNPVKALFYSAVLNGIVAVPLMAMLMLLASNKAALREFTVGPVLAALGWGATLLMAATVAVMFWSAWRG